MTGFLRTAAAIAATLLSSAAPAQQDSVWQNPSNSVHVRVHPCGTGMCGTVVWANDKAKADSARGGTPNLVGTELFRDFHEASPKLWKGKVFVPDLKGVFSGTGKVVDENTIIARGCAVGNIGCKSQTWTRVSQAAH